MDKQCIQRKVVLEVAKRVYQSTGIKMIPVAASNRHIHLSESEIVALFGQGYKLEVFKMLSQPGQFAAKEKVDIKGPKGTIKGVRVLGPARRETQVEIFVADSYRLGIKPVVRMSGDLDGSPGATLIGPKGEAVLLKGVVVAARHIHISPQQSTELDLKNGDVVSLRKDGKRAVVYENIPVRCGDGHSLELHLDIEEANAAMLKNGELLELISVK
jgi:putative phosphotransacetylase